MQVYRAYFKIIKKNLPQLLIYVAIFAVLNTVLVKVNSPSVVTGYAETKVNVAFFCDEEPTALTSGLCTYLSQHANLVTIDDRTEALQEALFYQDVSYILRIPPGFSEGFMSGVDVQLQKSSIANTAAAIHLDTLVNRYLNTARLYLKNTGIISQTELVQRIEQDLAQKTQVGYRSYKKNADSLGSIQFSFNYSAYVLLNLLIIGVSSFLLAYNQPDLQKRNRCSPVPLKSQNSQVLLGNLLYALMCWGVIMLLNLMLFGSDLFSKTVLVFCVNALVFTVVCLSLGFLVGNAIRNRTVQAATNNAVTLGMSFVGGVFVPQFLLGKTVLSIAQFTPTYWFVRANNEAATLTNFTLKTLSPILGYMGIQLGLAIAILAVALVITKQRQQGQTV